MEVFGDFHIHIGRSKKGKPIKITASKSLNFENIVYEAVDRKGLQIIGIIDCMSPYVIEDIEEFLEKQEAYEQEEGGIIYKNKICILLGSEVEVYYLKEDGKKGLAHNICFFKYLKDIKAFEIEMRNYIKNTTLSTQNSKLTGPELLKIVEKYGGILIPAHIFTPHKSYYGNCTSSLKEIFKEDFDKIKAVELGLSADTKYADRISELEDKVFLTNSDAHSLPKIAREYNKLEMEKISFENFLKLFDKKDTKNYIIANYGMDPRLGKYNRTYCENCNENSSIIVIDLPLKNGKIKENEKVCSKCKSPKVVKGVLDRVEEIADFKEAKNIKDRPEYVYQIPLQFIPGIGNKTLEKIIDFYESEMNVLHKVDEKSLCKNFGQKIAKLIVSGKDGRLKLQKGGGRTLRKNNKRIV